MAGHLPGNLSDHHEVLEASLCSRPAKWYFTKEEIDEQSPSRKDGIDLECESHLRQLYCSHLQQLGMELKVPQMTIATAMMLCHRFYMRQSHAKNHWQTLANASMFLACKAEDTPRWLKDLIVMSYKLMYSSDPLAPQKIKQKEIYYKQKELILVTEQMILVTVAFDLNIEHPYKPLVAALKRLELSEKEVVKVAWNFVNDWLRTTLCLQYKPHYIAAGSLFLAAKLKRIKLPTANGKAWWMQFEVSPKQLEEVTQHMLRLLGKNTTTTQATDKVHSKVTSVAVKEIPCSMETTTRTTPKVPAAAKPNQKPPTTNDTIDPARSTEKCPSESSSANSVVEDCDAGHIIGDSSHKSGCQIVSVKRSCPGMDIARIREKLKSRKLEKVGNKKPGGSLGDEVSGEDWIELEIEKGIESVSASS